jgi:hypothetical protein
MYVVTAVAMAMLLREYGPNVFHIYIWCLVGDHLMRWFARLSSFP